MIAFAARSADKKNPTVFSVHAVLDGDRQVIVSSHVMGHRASVGLDTATARLFAKAIVDAADKIDIEAFVEAGVPLQRSDCE